MFRAKIEAFDGARKIERGESLAAPSAISAGCQPGMHAARRYGVELRYSVPVPRDTLAGVWGGGGGTWPARPRGGAGERWFLLAASPVKEVAPINSEDMRRRVIGG